MLLKTLAAIGLIDGLLVGNASTLLTAFNITTCNSAIDLQNADLHKFVECLARSTNLTSLTADTMVKLELLAKHVQLWKTIQSPYWQIDDVLKIDRSSIAELDCQDRLHVVYGLRRKVAQLELMYGVVDSEILNMPLASSKIKVPQRQPPSIIACDNCAKPEDIRELTCLIGRAIRRERHKQISISQQPIK